MQQSNKKKTDEPRLIRSLVYQVKNHPNKYALIADLPSNRPYNPFSEESKQMVHTLGNVECFELWEISPGLQYPYCRKYWTESIVYCACGACLIPSESTRKLNRVRFDALTIPNFVIATRVPSSKRLLGEGEKEELRFKTILQRFQGSETYRDSQFNIGWDEEFCEHSDEITQESHSYVATWQERQRYKKVWKSCLNSQGPVGPMKSRPDFPDAVRRIREIKLEAEEVGYEIKPIIRLILQVRQRPRQHIQHSGKTAAWTVDPKTGWVW